MNNDILRIDETATNFLKRNKVKPIINTGLAIIDEQIPEGICGGDVLEIYGRSQTGKTELLLNILSHCILPEQHQKIKYQGANIRVVFFDNDARFPIWRLVTILENRIITTILRSLPEPIDENNNELVMQTVYQILGSEAKYEEFIRSCLSKLIIYQCTSAHQFWITLLGILESVKNSVSDVCRVIMVDSLNSFYYCNKNDHDRAARVLAQIAQHNVSIITTKSPLFYKEMRGITHSEFMCKEYASRVSYRILLERPQESTVVNAEIQAVNQSTYQTKRYRMRIVSQKCTFEDV